MRFKDNIAMDGATRYVALANKESDVIDAYSTDGLISYYDLVVLEDDKQYFLPYYGGTDGERAFVGGISGCHSCYQ